jgi:hypothetical protein
MSLSSPERKRKMRVVTEFMGYYDPKDLLSFYQDKKMAPGICTEKYCDGISLVECDEESGYCWDCGRDSIQSILIFSGIN